MKPPFDVPLAVVCHDLGAAQLILPWLDPDDLPLRAVMQGPALDAWQQRFGGLGLVRSLDDALDGAAQLLSGSSLGSDLEHRARLLAAVQGVRSVGVVDHWVHYAARFQRDGRRQLPDEIWVCDAEAFALAQATFPGHDVRLQPNHFLREQVERIAPSPCPQRHPEVLVLTEPVGTRWGGRAPGEEQALNFLLAHAHRLGLSPPLTLRLRLHEAESAERWLPWIDAQRGGHDIALDRSPTLAAAIDRFAWVAGLESMALVVALAAGRRAVCLQPPWAPRARLPQRGLIHLRDLLVAQRPPG